MLSASRAIRATPKQSAAGAVKNSRDHLFDDLRERPEWRGEGPEIFRLGKYVNQRHFENLLAGFDPNGLFPLVENAGDEKRQAGWHFTFAAPKALSVFYACAPKEIQDTVVSILKSAAEKGTQTLEESAALTRVLRGDHERQALFWANFLHFESQALDPHLHVQKILVNLCVHENGTTGAIRSLDFFRAIGKAGIAFEAELAALAEQKLGLQIVLKDKGGFHIEGIPPELCDALSKRGQQIKAELERKNESGPRASRFAAHNTRPDKEIVSHDALVTRWKRVAMDFGFTEADAVKLVKQENAKTLQNIDVEKFARGLKALAHDMEMRRLESAAALDRLWKSGMIEAGEFHWNAKKDSDGKQGLIHGEWQRLFKNAPAWSPASLLKAPVLVFGKPRLYRYWGDIRFERKSALGQLRIQNRILFGNAPRWSPFRYYTLPALRFGKMRLREHELWGEKKQKLAAFKFGELRLQDRRLFPRALPLNPAKNFKIPMPRFVGKEQLNAETRFNKNIQHEH